MSLQKHMAAYLSTQRTTAGATRGQEVPAVDDPAKGTVDRVAAAIVETTRAKASGSWQDVTVIEFPKRGDAARDAMAEILAQVKAGHRRLR